ncbi:hypothetical protein FE391_03860 [Nonomuraea sp. KC401]|uniref:hypothetical protein n=1 Tax=unclassified Nonomuraea TaxID=2593643 RepID=UPI0010FDD41D|nr:MULTISPECIES: hypothetical protein [unclassified Nonomuraea]NBE92685.1 hypothetical protein [Nonomuraea sp. K271]TLF84634.1 hypothetical protein FE391_03860 [Nonomuraea sp. KC401]
MNESASPARLAHRLAEVVGELRGIPVDVERLDDSELVRQQIAQLAGSAGELRAMHPVGEPAQGRQELRSRRSVLDALRRGMTMRTIVHADVLDDPRKALVVGVHFVALAPVWKDWSIAVPGVVLTLLRAAGLALAPTAAVAWVPVVSGVLSGVVLLAAAVTMGLRALTGRPAEVS